MQVIKTFIAASEECKTNLKFFQALWTGKLGSEEVKLNARDRHTAAMAAYQTLFLLVPVISSTFASVQRFFKDLPDRNLFGLLVVDESGQALPQMAVGSLLRARKAIIVGDPKQVEPVVTDELDMLRYLFHEEKYLPYKDKTISVQRCADLMNEIGTYMKDTESKSYEWLGCPLLVHRRCISPMFDISNEISYAGIMKKSTPVKEKPVIFDKSLWIEAESSEEGNKNHFVTEHGEIVCRLLDAAFKNSYKDKDVSKHGSPSIYIISPFTSVVSGIKNFLKKHRPDYDMKGKIGTVHTFQGKEATEVIFLLGCDSQKGAEGAIKWVNNNIVNVAATRAKNRFYVVAQFRGAWEKQGENGPVYKMYDILKNRHCVLTWEEAGRLLTGAAAAKAEPSAAPRTAAAKDKPAAKNVAQYTASCPICRTNLQKIPSKNGKSFYWKCSHGHYYADSNGRPGLQKCSHCNKFYILRKNGRYGTFYQCSNMDCNTTYTFDEQQGSFTPKK